MAAPMSTSLRPPVDFFPSFKKDDLLVLAGEYRAGTLLEWDQLRLFDELPWGPATPDMFVLSWELSGLHSNLVVVMDSWSQAPQMPGSSGCLAYRLLLARSRLLELIDSRHLVAAMALHYNMGASKTATGGGT
ncbi:uncharacterized protein N7515_009276 [Penicillium bovifimosum]|uniref:Uncharacterized protein n=1 Tax=Penicillium bovifimosum TaxID=126998 RepID=A0A9W9GJA5_9EURO|nr:uncharacterized protein N7515_009276 [Penicillium bovifimosum]KAJ5121315.1 hypothetical protein N7515_009276 [Penicillium bovifimosum]